jgi:hypothetical protein
MLLEQLLGGGSVDEGARRMYQLMDALEGRRT